MALSIVGMVKDLTSGFPATQISGIDYACAFDMDNRKGDDVALRIL